MNLPRWKRKPLLHSEMMLAKRLTFSPALDEIYATLHPFGRRVVLFLNTKPLAVRRFNRTQEQHDRIHSSHGRIQKIRQRLGQGICQLCRIRRQRQSEGKERGQSKGQTHPGQEVEVDSSTRLLGWDIRFRRDRYFSFTFGSAFGSASSESKLLFAPAGTSRTARTSITAPPGFFCGTMASCVVSAFVS